MQQSLESVTEQLKADAAYSEEITQKAEESSVRVKTLEEAILEMGKDKKETMKIISNQKHKIEKLQKQNDMFRKFYARNMADKRPEQTDEVDQVFRDFQEAFNAKDNFIDRNMQELKGVVNNSLKNKFAGAPEDD